MTNVRQALAVLRSLLVVLTCLVALVGGAAVAIAFVADCDYCQRLLHRVFVTPEHPQSSPSGEFTARIEQLTLDQGGHETWTVAITDRAGEVVFRDRDSYSTRHRLHIRWESDKDVLWIVPPDDIDGGPSFVMPNYAGTWVKIVYLGWVHSLPDDIDRLRRISPEAFRERGR